MEAKQKILIVDDKAENLFSLKKVLADTQAEFVEALSGNDALIASLNHDFALAILDVQMPEMDGYELAEFLRSEEKTRHMPIIFVSAVYSSDYHVFKGYEAGGVDFLVKPFEARILLSKVNIFLELDRQQKALAESKAHIARQLYELKASEDRFESLVETVPDIVYRIDKKGCFRFLNHAVKRLGYRPEELMGQHFSTLILPVEVDDVSREPAVKKLNGTPKQGGLKLFDERRTGERKTTGLEIRLIPKKGSPDRSATLEAIGGETVVVEVNSAGLYAEDVTLKTKMHLGTVGVIRDITQRKQLEDHLRRSNQELERRVAERTLELVGKNRELMSEIELRKEAEKTVRAAQKRWEEIFEAIGHMAVVVDAGHRITAANRSAVKQTGLTKEALIGARCHDIFHNSGKPVTGCPMENYIKHKTAGSTEMIVEAWDKTFICNSTPVFASNGGFLKLIHIFTDITRRKVLEKELIQAHKMEAIGTLAGGIAHDFNNILSAQIGFSQLALNNAEKGSLMEDDLTEILNCGHRAKELVRQILTFARQSDEEYAHIHLDYIVKEVSKFIRSTIPTSIELKTRVESASSIFANATQIHQVLMNLCTNAAHAMKAEGGVLEISLTDTTADRENPAEINGLEPGAYARIEVSDTGTGIPAGVLEKIYEPYFTTKPQGEGTGMGLAVVQGIVKDIGGRIRLKTAPDQGTVFTILIPVAEKTPPESKAEETSLKTGGGEHILLVDDEESITKVGKRILEGAGYRVTVANKPLEALAGFKEDPGKFDLVMTDLTMPGITGEKLMEKILEIRSDIPVVLCTGYQNKKLLDGDVKGLCSAFVQKPIDQTVLIKTLREVLDGREGKTGIRWRGFSTISAAPAPAGP